MPPLMSQTTATPVLDAPPHIELDTFLRMAVAQGVSDIHLRVGSPPALRKDGHMMVTKLPPMDDRSMMAFARSVFPANRQDLLVKHLTDYDFSFLLEGIARFRVNLFHELGAMGLVLRIIPLKVPSFASLDLPSSIEQFTRLNRGLVLVTGPTGSGKSTSLAALLNKINLESNRHIITLEDPIEFVHQNASSVITQRQVGVDTDDFPKGIRQALRQDPDVILIGEMRDRETIMSAIQAAETGHLVFSTLHTADTVQTISRMINAFEPHEREPIRMQIASVFQGAISQRLVRRIEGKGRIAATEVLVATSTVRDYILKNELDEIYSLLSTGQLDGMFSLNHSLYRAYKNQVISEEDALATSENPLQLSQFIRGAFHGTLRD
jgi:twitching motility protein PilT